MYVNMKHFGIYFKTNKKFRKKYIIKRKSKRDSHLKLVFYIRIIFQMTNSVLKSFIKDNNVTNKVKQVRNGGKNMNIFIFTDYTHNTISGCSLASVCPFGTYWYCLETVRLILDF